MKFRKHTVALSATLLLASAPALAINPFSAQYEASYMGMQAEGRMKLEAAGKNRWRYTLSVNNALADLRQSTVFEEHGGQWRPLSGEDSAKVMVKQSNKQASYDWGKGVATWKGDVKADRAGPVDLKAGDMDALLINLAVVRDVAAGKPLDYRMVEDGRVRQLSYRVDGKESITVGGKKHEATKVVADQGDKQIIAWVVKDLPVPARILHRKDGSDNIDLRIKSVN